MRPYPTGKMGFTTKGVVAGSILIYCFGIIIACTAGGKDEPDKTPNWAGRENDAIEITKNYAIDYGGMNMKLIELMSLHLVLMAADDPGLKKPEILGWLASQRPDESPSTYLCDLRVKFPHANDQIITYSFFTDVRTNEVAPANEITKSFWPE